MLFTFVQTGSPLVLLLHNYIIRANEESASGNLGSAFTFTGQLASIGVPFNFWFSYSDVITIMNVSYNDVTRIMNIVDSDVIRIMDISNNVAIQFMKSSYNDVVTSMNIFCSYIITMINIPYYDVI